MISAAAGPARLTQHAGRHTSRGVCDIAVVNHLARMLMAAFRANEYRDFDIKDRVDRLDPLEP
jgi:hypothetical protein